MGLGIDAPKKLSIAMIVLGLAYLLVFILQMKYRIKLLLVPNGMISMGYITVTLLLALHYVSLSDTEPPPQCDNKVFSICDHKLRYFSVIIIGLLSAPVMISVFIKLFFVLHI